MNKEQLIDKMRSSLPNNEWAKNDFENYDLQSVQKNMEPFLWMVRGSGTSLCYIGPTYFKEMVRTSAARMEIFRNILYIISSVSYALSGSKIYYWNGISLDPISLQNAEELVKNIWGKTVERLKEEYPEEVQVCNEPLPIVYASYDTQQAVESTKRFAKSIGDNSFEKCLENLSHWRRVAVHQCILLYRDHNTHDYGFAERINDNNKIVGGIIKHETGWQIHT